MRRTLGIDAEWGLTVMRLAAAIVLVRAGWIKVMVAGLGDVSALMAEYGLPLPMVAGALSAAFELLGGAALALGWFTRTVGALTAVHFALALAAKARFGMFVLLYVDILMLAAGILLALAGPGRLGLDGRRGGKRR
jgi:putative oxidoreductase